MRKRNVICAFMCAVLSASCVLAPCSARPPEPELTVDARLVLSALVSLTDSHLSRLIDIMKVMAESSDMKSGTWEQMRPMLATLKHEHLPGVYCFVRPDGSYHTVSKGKQIKSLADRGYFPKVMSGKPVLGDLVISKSTEKKITVTTVPIKNGDKVIGALIVSVFLEDFSKYLAKALNLPENVYFFAVDDGGRIALHSDVTMILASRDFHQVSNAVYLAMEKMLREEEGSVTFEQHGISRTVIYTASPLTGWHFAVGTTD